MNFKVLLIIILLFTGCSGTSFIRDDNKGVETSVQCISIDGRTAVEVIYQSESNLIAYFRMEGSSVIQTAFILMIDANKDGVYETIFYDIDSNGTFDIVVQDGKPHRLE